MNRIGDNNHKGGESRATKRRKKNKLKKIKQIEFPLESSIEDKSENDEIEEIIIADTTASTFTNYSVKEKVIDFKCLNEFLSLKDVKEVMASDRSASVLQHLVKPIDRDEFFDKYIEQHPIHFKRINQMSYFGGLFNLSDFKKMLLERPFTYGEELLLSKWKSNISNNSSDNDNQIESNENQNHHSMMLQTDWSPTVEMNKVVDYKRDLEKLIKGGCTLNILCPQKYHDKLWHYISILEHEFQRSMTCEALLIPICSFWARRIDNFDCFLLGVEGSVEVVIHRDPEYNDLTREPWDCVDPFDSYEDSFDPYTTITLNQGDSIYIPSGWIYSVENQDSGKQSLILSIQMSQNSTTDLMDIILPQAIASSCQDSRELRTSISRDTYRFMGAAHSDTDDERRPQFTALLNTHINLVKDRALEILDAAVDQKARSFLMERLPIPLSSYEESKTVASILSEHLVLHTKLRIVRPDIARVIVENGMAVLYHCMDNSRVRFEEPIRPLEFDLDDGPAVEQLVSSYPHGIMIMELTHNSDENEDKLAVARAIFKEGLLMVVDDALGVNKSSNSDEDEDDDGIF